MWNFKKTTLLSGFLFILMSMFFISMILLHGNDEHPGYKADPEQVFELKVNGAPISSFTAGRLPDFTVHPGDEVEISLPLPQVEMYEPVLVCSLSYAASEIFIEDEKIYEHGTERERHRPSVGAGYHKIRLPEDFQGKRLRLRLTGLERYKFSYLFRGLFFCENHNIAVFIIRQHLFAFSTSVTLILFGILVLVIFLILYFVNIRLKGLVPLSMLSFSVGLWAICNIEFVRIFSDDLLLNNYIRYFSCYFSLLPWIVMVADLRRSSPYIKKFRYFAYLHLVFLSLVGISEFWGVIDYKRFMLFYNIFFVVALLFGLYVMGSGREGQKLYEKVLFLGNLIPACYVCVQLLFFNLGKYFSFSLKMDAGNFYLSLLVVVSVFFAAYGMRFSDEIAGRKEVEILKKMAYEDPLTGLENRQSAILRLLEYDRACEDYHVVMLDLNCLKRINDQYGHSCGDKMILRFADCMRRAFAKEATLCRWGGDEFIVILPTAEVKRVNQQLRDLLCCIAKVNCESQDERLCLETAYGVSSTKDGFGFDYEKILQSADEKMYRHKRWMKTGVIFGSSCHA